MLSKAFEMWVVATATGVALLVLVMLVQRVVALGAGLVHALSGRRPAPVQLDYAPTEWSTVKAAA